MEVQKLCIEFADCQLCPYGASVFVDKPPFRVFYRGNTDANLMLVGEGPGWEEIQAGRPFIGRAGKLLSRILAYIKVPEADVFITNSFVCSDDGKKKPTDEVLQACNDRLHRMIEAVQPKVLVCLGMYAHRAVLGLNEPQPLSQHLNKARLYNKLLTTFTEYHPAYLLRNQSAKKEAAVRWKHIGDTYHALVNGV
ncbi:MAG: uracil-DNA glycosylase [Nitrososphaera sp.]|nr:uracil-DNA glycosylase [Nitrososphaera sp.]